MKRYRFRLEQVLRVRRIEEERALAALLDAERRTVAADTTVAAELARYRAVATPGDGAAPTVGFLAERSRAGATAATLLAAGHAAAAARTEAASSRQGWQTAAQRVSALERLDERRRADHALESARDEERSTDDLVTGRAARLGATR